MKINFYIFFFSIFFGIGTVYSQSLSDDNTSMINNYFQNQKNGSILNVPTTSEVKQIVDADVIITQNGNYNTSYIVCSSNEKQEINQQGNYNNYEYYTYYSTNPSQVNTLQYGDNNSVQIFGQNELAKNMTIIQNTNNQTLVIKNY
jgi:hypothetical protein